MILVQKRPAYPHGRRGRMLTCVPPSYGSEPYCTVFWGKVRHSVDASRKQLVHQNRTAYLPS